MRVSFRLGFSIPGMGGMRLLASAALALCGTVFAPQPASASVASGIEQLAGQIVARSAAADRTTIAIASFPHVDDSCSELSNYLVDELVLSLFSLPDNQLSIIERSQLGRIFAELELSLSGAVDVNTTRELGRLHGVETLLIGSLTTIGDDLRVNARLIDTETGQVFSAAAVNIPRTSTIEELMQRPAAGGCTMSPTAATGSATAGPGAGSAAAPSGSSGQILALGAGELESFEQLLGEWFGMVECDGQYEEIWFLADRALANGVSGTFRRARFSGWGQGTVGSRAAGNAPGSASLTLMPGGDGEGITMRMAAQQYQNVRNDFSDSFLLQLVGRDALYGAAASDECNEVNLGLRREGGTD